MKALHQIFLRPPQFCGGPETKLNTHWWWLLWLWAAFRFVVNDFQQSLLWSWHRESFLQRSWKLRTC